ncbi:MAG: hypothetical protein AAF399_12420 [Bacteroidota bacterium]
MQTRQLIGQKIQDILVWSKVEVGGLDQAKVFLQLEQGVFVGMPWDLEQEHLESAPIEGSVSLFDKLQDEAIYDVNPEERSVAEILEAKEARANSWWGRIKKSFGITEGLPKEYRPYKIEYRENQTTHLQGQVITDILMFEDSDSSLIIELENGYFLRETSIAPHGTGMAGLHFYTSLQHFESRYNSEYVRFSDLEKD